MTVCEQNDYPQFSLIRLDQFGLVRLDRVTVYNRLRLVEELSMDYKERLIDLLLVNRQHFWTETPYYGQMIERH